MIGQRLWGTFGRAFGWALALCLLPCLWMLVASLPLTGGRYVYFLDDAYIHLGVGKNWVEHGVLGVNSGRFVNLSSSPFYTMLCAALYRLSPAWGEYGLLAASLLALVGLLWLVRRYLEATGGRPWHLLAFGVGLVVAGPIHILVLAGMEHGIHLCFCTGLLIGYLNQREGRGGLAMPVVFAILALLTRLETVFLLATLAGLAGLERRWRLALLPGLAAGLAVLAFLAWCHAGGGSWVPTSVGVKSTLDTSSLAALAQGLLRRVAENIKPADCLWLMALALVAGLYHLPKALAEGVAARHLPRERWLWLAVAGPTVAVYVLARTGHLMRYEAWLIGLALLAATTSLPHRLHLPDVPAKAWLWLTAGLALAAIPFPNIDLLHIGILALLCGLLWMALRSAPPGLGLVLLTGALLLPSLHFRVGKFLRQGPAYAANIYQQQVQMRLFLERFHPHERVILNDIGQVAYYTDSPVLDLAGLGSAEMAPYTARYIRNRRFNFARPLDSLATLQGARLALIYADWLPAIPPRWQRAGSFVVSNNYILGGDTVTVFGLDTVMAQRLRTELQAFAPQMPPGSTIVVTP